MNEIRLNPKVDSFLNREVKWHEEMVMLRGIVLSCELTEELKWGTPCYTVDGKNVVVIHGFKDYCALLFFKGALMKDPAGILIRQTENVQSGRQARFTGIDEITGREQLLKEYVLQAVEVEKSGRKVDKIKPSDLQYPEELSIRLDEYPSLQKAFDALTPGRKRAYVLFFAQPKQSATRISRIEKCIPAILAGKGLND